MWNCKPKRMNSHRTVVLALVACIFVLPHTVVHAQPEPPRFEAIVLDRFEVPDTWSTEVWRPGAITDDGTVYGYVYGDHGFDREYLTWVSRPGVGTRRLLRGAPTDEEIRPIAASNYGAVLLYRGRWPSDGVFVPGQGVTLMNGFHSSIFFPNDMNNNHVFAGQIGVCPNCSAVTWDQQRGFVVLGGPMNHSAQLINNRGNVKGHSSGLIQGEPSYIEQTIWRPNGRNSVFKLPTRTATGHAGFNEFDEAVGTHSRSDGWGGWYWSEETGLVEIPFLVDGRMSIYGISDDGWVLGQVSYTSDPVWFLWHVEAGFYELGELYEWEGRFDVPAVGFGGAVMNGAGQIVITNYLLGESGLRSVFLQPIK